jgi:hypothetical protein
VEIQASGAPKDFTNSVQNLLTTTGHSGERNFCPTPDPAQADGDGWLPPALLQRPPDRRLAALILAGQLGHGLAPGVTLGNPAAVAGV